MFVPVVAKDGTPLMPTKPARARRWIKSGKATPFWKRGIFCVRLNVAPSDTETQEIVVGVDPGSKKEGVSVKSAAHTYLNLQLDAVIWVSDAVKMRRMMRRVRRYRHCPYRQKRFNRKRCCLPPSTRARWEWKLRICRWLSKLFPITRFVEDIKAKTKKGQQSWNGSFSPLEVGKQWFYTELSKIAPVETKRGFETKQMQDALGLKKITKKIAEVFEAHAVDAWVLANSWTGGHTKPDNRELLCVTPIRLHRRHLHALQPSGEGVRRPYGGTRSLGFKRGSLIRHPRWGVVYMLEAPMVGRISLHDLATGKRLTQAAKPEDCHFRTFNAWRLRKGGERATSSVAFRRQSPSPEFL